MAYNELTLPDLKREFQLEMREESNLFTGFASVAISDLLHQLLAESVSLAQDLSTEKARSELIIAPVLMEVRRQLAPKISLFSGVEFNVDVARGLRGVCDFLLSLSPLQLFVEAPVVAVVEAKNENIKAGIGQCIGEMIAAQIFNQQQGNAIPIVYGVVTTGTSWRFMRLQETTVWVESAEHSIENPEKILGILVGMIREAMDRMTVTSIV